MCYLTAYAFFLHENITWGAFGIRNRIPNHVYVSALCAKQKHDTKVSELCPVYVSKQMKSIQYGSIGRKHTQVLISIMGPQALPSILLQHILHKTGFHGSHSLTEECKNILYFQTQHFICDAKVSHFFFFANNTCIHLTLQILDQLRN